MRAFLTANWNFSPELIFFLSSWCEEIDWYERSLSINMSATQHKQQVNIGRPDIYR